MSTLIRTWNTSMNNALAAGTVLANGQKFWRAWKDSRVAAGWVVKSCSDSVAYGVDDNVDRWDSDSDIVWAAAGVAHSWIVLESPAGMLPNSKKIRVLVDMSTGAGSPHLINVTASSSAINTGGSTTAAPTGTAADLRSFANKQFQRSSYTVCKYHMMRSNKPDTMAFISVDTENRIPFAMGVLVGDTIEVGENYPVIFFIAYADNATGGAFVRSNMTGTGTVAMWDNDGTISSNAGMCGIMFGSSDALVSYGTSGNPLSSFGTVPAAPILLMSAGDTLGFRGTLVDVKQGPSSTTTPAQGYEEPASGTTTTCFFGNYWVPNGGVAPLL